MSPQAPLAGDEAIGVVDDQTALIGGILDDGDVLGAVFEPLQRIRRAVDTDDKIWPGWPSGPKRPFSVKSRR